MVQIGARVETCVHCSERKVVGEFWYLPTRLKLFFCADCLERAALAVRPAAPKVEERIAS